MPRQGEDHRQQDGAAHDFQEQDFDDPVARHGPAGEEGGARVAQGREDAAPHPSSEARVLTATFRMAALRDRERGTDHDDDGEAEACRREPLKFKTPFS
jgi:hypothetical protein